MKRLVDVCAATLGLVVLAPLMLIIGVVVRLTSPGPAIFKQTRVGLEGKHFRVLKFRTMCVGAEALSRETLGTGDPRITGVGMVLRRYKLDELPQLINVVKGDMSLVGPRPEIPSYADHYTEEDRIVLSVRPGITDPASLALIELDRIMDSRGEEPAPDFYRRVVMSRKLEMQRQYIAERSMIGDLQIIARTVRSAWVRDRRG